jgi:hypothetical protein
MHAMSFNNDTKSQLEGMLSVQSDLGRAKASLDALLSESAVPSEFVPALYTHFLVSYARSFTTGRRIPLRNNVFSDPMLLAIHEEIISIRNTHVSHPVSDHEHCMVIAAVPDLDQNDAVGLAAKYWFFLVDPLEKLKTYRRVLEFTLNHVSDEVDRLGNQLAEEVLGKGYTWKSAQQAFWSIFSADDIYGPGASELSAGQTDR